MTRTDIFAALPRGPRLLSRAFRALGLARTLRRERARLTALDEHLLRDIGLSRDEALSEAQRPAWDVPAHWLDRPRNRL